MKAASMAVKSLVKLNTSCFRFYLLPLKAFENQLKHRKREFEDEKACFVDKKKTLEDKVMKLQDGMEDIMKANTCISQQLDQYKSNAQVCWRCSWYRLYFG